MTPTQDGPADGSELSQILAAGRRDARTAFRRLVPLLYDELRSLARRHLRSRRPGMQLETTELVHETFLRLAGREVSASDRGHFFSLAAQAMRQILVDLARRAGAAKRGSGKRPETLEETVLAEGGEPERWLAVDEALHQLKDVHPRLVRVVECRFFAGLTEEETAQALGVTSRTVQRDWKRARLWLRQFLTAAPGREAPE